LKGSYDRTRPPGSLVATSGASFPSGHSIAASVTVVAAVIALVPPGRARVAWGAAAAGFSVLMALSRAYLGAHWLSEPSPGSSSAPRARCWPHSWRTGSSAAAVPIGRVVRPIRPCPVPFARRTGDEQPPGRRRGGTPHAVLAVPSPGRRDPADRGGFPARLLAHRLGGRVPAAARPVRVRARRRRPGRPGHHRPGAGGLPGRGGRGGRGHAARAPV